MTSVLKTLLALVAQTACCITPICQQDLALFSISMQFVCQLVLLHAVIALVQGETVKVAAKAKQRQEEVGAKVCVCLTSLLRSQHHFVKQVVAGSITCIDLLPPVCCTACQGACDPPCYISVEVLLILWLRAHCEYSCLTIHCEATDPRGGDYHHALSNQLLIRMCPMSIS